MPTETLALEERAKELVRELKDCYSINTNEQDVAIARAALEAAVAQDRACTPTEKLIEAVRDLYYAAHWTPDRDVDAIALWTAVRDAAGFEAGHAPDAAQN